ncbi:hypothetical protein PsorP6_000126 [Peronosclerospora sorghi]|uniref:Uncharacterized protein n=1 Tax=Peronosclerospora sorghi TaxID=230839 RepID=A0ACC0WWC9_9STRA|nr:hypothetical protein PsorP6_000126 [Peronosclerospora sorghi]
MVTGPVLIQGITLHPLLHRTCINMPLSVDAPTSTFPDAARVTAVKHLDRKDFVATSSKIKEELTLEVHPDFFSLETGHAIRVVMSTGSDDPNATCVRAPSPGCLVWPKNAMALEEALMNARNGERVTVASAKTEVGEDGYDDFGLKKKVTSPKSNSRRYVNSFLKVKASKAEREAAALDRLHQSYSALYQPRDSAVGSSSLSQLNEEMDTATLEKDGAAVDHRWLNHDLKIYPDHAVVIVRNTDLAPVVKEKNDATKALLIEMAVAAAVAAAVVVVAVAVAVAVAVSVAVVVAVLLARSETVACLTGVKSPPLIADKPMRLSVSPGRGHV